MSTLAALPSSFRQSAATEREKEGTYFEELLLAYGKMRVDSKTVADKTTLVYNEHITLKGIPLEA